MTLNMVGIRIHIWTGLSLSGIFEGVFPRNCNACRKLIKSSCSNNKATGSTFSAGMSSGIEFDVSKLSVKFSSVREFSVSSSVRLSTALSSHGDNEHRFAHHRGLGYLRL